LSRWKLLYVVLVLAVAAALVFGSVYAGDGNGDQGGIIRAVLLSL
jgi:hypothetical protein